MRTRYRLTDFSLTVYCAIRTESEGQEERIAKIENVNLYPKYRRHLIGAGINRLGNGSIKTGYVYFVNHFTVCLREA